MDENFFQKVDLERSLKLINMALQNLNNSLKDVLINMSLLTDKIEEFNKK